MDDKIRTLYKMSYKLRMHVLEMVHHAKTGHAAPCMSIAEIMSVLYFNTLNLDPANPLWNDRDRFILSKGHASPIYYAALAERGFFPVDDLLEYRQLNSKLQGHPCMDKCPGVDMTTGSLGNGLSAAVGKALIGKKEARDYSVYSITGDGELQEGIIWEAVMFAGNAKLDNLIVFVDRNNLQSGGNVDRIQSLGDLDKKFESFGWNTQSIDGHNIEQIIAAIEKAKACKDKPSVIIADTLKGKGVSYMEGQFLWHMKAPNDAEFAQGMKELEKEMEKYA